MAGRAPRDFGGVSAGLHHRAEAGGGASSQSLHGPDGVPVLRLRADMARRTGGSLGLSLVSFKTRERNMTTSSQMNEWAA